MSRRDFECLVRKIVRMIYTEPLVHIIIDFIIENQIAEVFSFAFLHQIEGKNK